MNDLQREKKKGITFPYLAKGAFKRLLAGKRYQTPGFGLASQLFSTMAKHIIEKLGPEEGEALIKQAVESFGRERGKRITLCSASSTNVVRGRRKSMTRSRQSLQNSQERTSGMLSSSMTRSQHSTHPTGPR